VSIDRLQQQFRQYALRDEMDERTLTITTPPTTEPDSVRDMRPDELHLMMARVRPWDSRESILAAGAELAQARRLAGDTPSAELRFWSALYDLRWRRFGDAEREARAALALEPSQPRYWLLLCELLSRHDRVSPRAPAAPPTMTPDPALAPETEAEELDDAVAHLRPLARSAQALNFLARYYSDRGRVDEGLPFAERAVATEHGCWECADTLAQLQHSVRVDRSSPPGANDTNDTNTKRGIL
jgi:tetratricopeptide (TPR) repeat protein